MLDELFDLDRDGGRRDARRRNGDSRYNDTDDEYPHRQERERRRRREDREGFDFGDD